MSVKILNAENFDTETSKGIALIDFYADWCGPCKMMSPTVDEFSEKHPEINVCKVNVDDAPSLADKFNIDMIPALVFIKDGSEAHRDVGVIPMKNLETTLVSIQ